MKKVLIILFLIMLVVTMFQIINSYALYKNELTGNYETLLGMWLININEVDISSGTEVVKFDLPPEYVKTENSDFVAEGKIAPDGQLYFELLLDARKTDVSVRYDIEIGEVEEGKNVEYISELTGLEEKEIKEL